ncbi:tripartite tricarboxylate transporter family receptor [Treponema socranskii subsp. socranskii VPI DR56BR1116 = ATCC 35536]|uniref:Tripartite tricarboxylate transporter family receptor n=1 Tax=Treponema socranskii subsp. socranskii VPI DR56BR1116 = ATCC 35536 TaxID=1125725 RepID=U1FKI0_TRESO|nr:tripartite tricarboxylate transporter substrate-binding protein [Treponema socranskii]ERF59871.1 tripartite tricarboxylate transporter family receptor [Treponema socranskii subsp. socranskii VPI DR56BR1116 = ATCC 35536]
MKKNVCFILIVCMVVCAYAKDGTEKTFSPTRDINWTVTSKPGGGSDIYTRIITDIAKKNGFVKKNFLINYKTDGGGEVGRNAVATTRGDLANYTLLTFNSGDLMPMIKNTNNRLANFKPIALMAVDKQILLVNADSKYQTMQSFIAAVKAGEKLTIAGSREDDYMTYKALMAELGFSEETVPYINNDSTSDALTSVLGGHVTVAMGKPAASRAYVESGKMKAVLALSTTRFGCVFGNTPTLSEIGSYNDVEVPVWRGVAAPAAMSDAAVKFYSELMKQVSSTSEWENDYIHKNGLIKQYMNSSEAAAFMEQFEKDYLKKIGKKK